MELMSQRPEGQWATKASETGTTNNNAMIDSARLASTMTLPGQAFAGVQNESCLLCARKQVNCVA